MLDVGPQCRVAQAEQGSRLKLFSLNYEWIKFVLLFIFNMLIALWNLKLKIVDFFKNIISYFKIYRKNILYLCSTSIKKKMVLKII